VCLPLLLLLLLVLLALLHLQEDLAACLVPRRRPRLKLNHSRLVSLANLLLQCRAVSQLSCV
jgi:hypothetical protein